MPDEIDVVSFSPSPSPDISTKNTTTSFDEKPYFCQRCLNHNERFPRKGHKPNCRYLTCECADCSMVEQRRRLNNALSRKKKDDKPRNNGKGKRVRDPQCARCSTHGVHVPLRGHKKISCPFATCGCEMCTLVEGRRSLMAKQIKLRRQQQRSRTDGAAKDMRTNKENLCNNIASKDFNNTEKARKEEREERVKRLSISAPSSPETSDVSTPSPCMTSIIPAVCSTQSMTTPTSSTCSPTIPATPSAFGMIIYNSLIPQQLFNTTQFHPTNVINQAILMQLFTQTAKIHHSTTPFFSNPSILPLFENLSTTHTKT